MIKKYKYIVLLILLTVVIVAAGILSRLFRNPAETSSGIEDISDKFVIIPKNEYSLNDKAILIPPDTTTVPGIPEQIKIKVSVQNSFSKPLWLKGKDCNYQGVMEKKTVTGWAIADDEKCAEEKESLPGRFFNNGNSEISHTIFTRQAAGTYRIRLNLLYGCVASKGTADQIVYKDCQREVVSYSPSFAVVE